LFCCEAFVDPNPGILKAWLFLNPVLFSIIYRFKQQFLFGSRFANEAPICSVNRHVALYGTAIALMTASWLLSNLIGKYLDNGWIMDVISDHSPFET
jgi:hypothetical protein